MDKNLILSKVDHTNLNPCATWQEIETLCSEAMAYHTASVCIAPAYVARAAAYLKGRVPICTVAGFPNGYCTTQIKAAESRAALEQGAEEIDMVVNLGWVKDGRFDFVLEEIQAVKAACGKHVLKVIIETCLLSEREKIKLCEVVSQSGAEFIKTSTGFSKGGATRDDIILFSEHIAPHVSIKAAGGIKSVQDAQEFIRLGASRLGTSSLVGMIAGGAVKGAY